MMDFPKSQILNYFRLSQSAYLYSCGNFKGMKCGGGKLFSEKSTPPSICIPDFLHFRVSVNLKARSQGGCDNNIYFIHTGPLWQCQNGLPISIIMHLWIEILM